MVPLVRLERTHPQRTIDFESIASTNSAIEAQAKNQNGFDLKSIKRVFRFKEDYLKFEPKNFKILRLKSQKIKNLKSKKFRDGTS